MADRSVFADAGRRGAAKRWGERRVIDLRTLDPATAGVIRAIIAAHEHATKEAGPADNGPALAEVHGNARSA
jgi:hypothetical protein